jgi:hypothetical protein
MEELPKNGIKSFQFYFFLYLSFTVVCLIHVTSLSDIGLFTSDAPLSFSYGSIPVQLNFFAYFTLVPGIYVFLHGIVLYILSQLFTTQPDDRAVTPGNFLLRIIKLRNLNNKLFDYSKYPRTNRILHKLGIKSVDWKEQLKSYTPSNSESLLTSFIFVLLFIVPSLLLWFYFYKYLNYADRRGIY